MDAPIQPAGTLSPRKAHHRRRPESLHAFAARALDPWSLVIVTNRAPHERIAENRIRRAPGGVVTAMLSVAEATSATWIACARNEVERTLSASELRVEREDGRSFRQRFAMTDAAPYSKHYAVVANPLLWFLQHYLWPLAYEPSVDEALEDAWTNGYAAVNRSIAACTVAAAKALPKAPLILFQDYHLYLAPRLVRERLPSATLQHFVHIPWPTPQYWTVLPPAMRNAIIDGLLACDVIGFQTQRDVMNFLACCEELCGLRLDYRERAVLSKGRVTWVRAYPVSIDVRALRRHAASARVAEEARLIAGWRPEKLILRVDRVDPTKNLVRGFRAYERLLEHHPEFVGNVTFWAFLQPSRQDIPAYANYMKVTLETVDHVNRRFARPGWLPIRLELRESIDRAVAGYASFDVLLVNSIYDGMNLVAKEGITVNENDGVLVLSENAGASQELGADALTINPFDVAATAEALYAALAMPHALRRRRLGAMKATVRRHDIDAWLRRQIEDIREFAPRLETQPSTAVPAANGNRVGERAPVGRQRSPRHEGKAQRSAWAWW